MEKQAKKVEEAEKPLHDKIDEDENSSDSVELKNMSKKTTNIKNADLSLTLNSHLINLFSILYYCYNFYEVVICWKSERKY